MKRLLALVAIIVAGCGQGSTGGSPAHVTTFVSGNARNCVMVNFDYTSYESYDGMYCKADVTVTP